MAVLVGLARAFLAVPTRPWKAPSYENAKMTESE
jgi:hypothetical protein